MVELIVMIVQKGGFASVADVGGCKHIGKVIIDINDER